MELISSALVVLVFGLATIAALAWLACAGWVFRDARRRSLDSAVPWGVGVLLTGPIGFVAYVMFQGSSRSAALNESAD